MANSETPITLEEQVVLMKKYVSFRQRAKMRKFLLYAGYFRASRYGKILLSNVGNIGSKSKQDVLYDLYQFDVDLRRILNYYCNRVEVRFKSAMSMMYNYLRGDLRKNILAYSFEKNKYSKKDTELVDTWLDGVRNLRNYCAHNSMVVGMTSSVVLRDPVDDVSTLPNDNDLFSRLYALKKLLPKEDAVSLKNDLKRLVKKCKHDVHTLGILPTAWEDMFDNINEF